MPQQCYRVEEVLGYCTTTARPAECTLASDLFPTTSCPEFDCTWRVRCRIDADDVTCMFDHAEPSDTPGIDNVEFLVTWTERLIAHRGDDRCTAERTLTAPVWVQLPTPTSNVPMPTVNYYCDLLDSPACECRLNLIEDTCYVCCARAFCLDIEETVSVKQVITTVGPCQVSNCDPYPVLACPPR